MKTTKGRLTLTAIVVMFSASVASGGPTPATGVSFKSSDPGLQRLFEAAEAKGAANIVPFTPDLKVLVEGGGYGNAWIETQPMGGEMYAKRDVRIAYNNQLVFMLGQRADGRLPGMVIGTEAARRMVRGDGPPEGMIWIPGTEILADFEMFQGYCFPDPAWRTYFWIGEDRSYLQKLYTALEKHDAYLWRTRDSNGDGLLETWCVWDTGEDGSSRLVTRNAPTRWPFEFPPLSSDRPDPENPEDLRRYWGEHAGGHAPKPTREGVLAPFASMDVMGYSYDGRATLAKIARVLGNGQETFWTEAAESVRQQLIEGLWDPVRQACFDRDRHGHRLDELIHNNLRVMYHGAFTQEMADAFIREHLLNPAEFWTPVPLVSIAHNEPLYQSVPGNNWGGQPQGLTYQRAIRALENYGHYAEVTLLGRKLLPVLIRNGCTFPQQLDAFTGAPSGPKPDGYGPMILASLEYISRLHGIHVDVEQGRVWWSGLVENGHDYSYTQRWGDQTWRLVAAQGLITAELNGRTLFSCTTDVRVVTDLAGNVLELVGIDSHPREVTLNTSSFQQSLIVRPNELYRRSGSKLSLAHVVPFQLPPTHPATPAGDSEP